MIDQHKFSAGMGILAANFNRNLEAAVVKVYYGALSAALTTDEFERAVERCIAEETFWPPVALIVGKIKPTGKGADPAPTVDSSPVLRRIEKLAQYNPHTSMIYPRVEEVREKIGDEAAYAYATAGAQRCFADNETTREICSREFHKALEQAVRNPTAQLRILGHPTHGTLKYLENPDAKPPVPQ